MMMFQVKISPKQDSYINSNCKITECMTGGLSRLIRAPNIIECTDVQVEKQGYSILKKDATCNNLIDKYHVINDNKTIIGSFLQNMNMQDVSKSNNLLPLFLRWLNLNLHTFQAVTELHKHTNYKSIADLWRDYQSCVDLIALELEQRSKHLRECVCLSNQGHSFRIDLLRQVLLVAQTFENFVYTSFCFERQVLFTYPNLYKFYFLLVATKQFQTNTLLMKQFTAELKKAIHELQTTHLEPIKFDTRGEVDLNYNKRLVEFVKFDKLIAPYVHGNDGNYVEHFIQRQLKVTIESLYYESKVFGYDAANSVSCVEIDPTSQDVTVNMNYQQLSNYINKTFKYDVNPNFLKSFVESNHPAVLYTTCFMGLIKYNLATIEHLCKEIPKLKIERDIKQILVEICKTLGGGGGGATAQESFDVSWTFNQEMESKIRRLVPMINNNYKQLLASQGVRVFKDSSYSFTGNLIKDLRFLSETALITLLVQFEHEWKQFKQKYSIPKFASKHEQYKTLRAFDRLPTKKNKRLGGAKR
jgi:hypothetical protein